MPEVTSRLELLQVQKLLYSVRVQDARQIEKLLAQGVPNLINYHDPESGETALHLAAKENKTDMVELLLGSRADINAADRLGRTALMKALDFGHDRTVKVLLDWKANARVQDLEGRNAFFYCLHPTARHAQCLEYLALMRLKVNLNCEDAEGMPLLCAAAKEGYKLILEKLLQLKADPNAQHRKLGTSAVSYAANCGSSECIQLLAKAGANLNAQDAQGRTASHLAASKGFNHVLHTLAAFGADFSIPDAKGNTCIHTSIEVGDKEVCKFLAQRGCPPSETNDEEKTPKKLADEFGFKDLVKELKKATTVYNKVEAGGKPKGYTELWKLRVFDWSVLEKSALASAFAEADADDEGTLSLDVFVDLLKKLGVSASEDDLHKIALAHDKKKSGKVNYEEFLKGNKYVSKQYAAYAAEPKEKGKKKKGGKKKGKKKGKFKVAFPIVYSTECEKPLDCMPPEIMIERHQHVSDESRFSRDRPPSHLLQDDSLWYVSPPEKSYVNIFDAIRQGDVDSFHLAIRRGTSIDIRDRYNKTPLMVASALGQVEFIRTLLAKEADVHAVDNFQWTALHHACHAGQPKSVIALIEGKANINAQSANGGTPLMRAIESSQTEIVKILLDKGANGKLENAQGKNALDLAMQWASPEVLLLVRAKFDTLPDIQTKDKGKKGGKGGKGAKGGKSAAGKKTPKQSKRTTPLPPAKPATADQIQKRGGGPLGLPSPEALVMAQRHRANVRRVMSATHLHPTLLFQPKSAWAPRPPTTDQVLKRKASARVNRGIDVVDFGEERIPFQISILARAQAVAQGAL
ncbi:ankyrin repeat and EF-hand domain-containing protein 1-like [Oscarella lobularis]|uniref:ankyrin repeat and EF-hand domain-containing protein 1-like n=1 Tax=Oscarella lobularis TaxID=121494 RepID=UPI003313B972